jgi:hypothetical protein
MDIENKNEDRTASMGGGGSAGVARAEETSTRTTDRDQEVDDRGTSQTEAIEILRNLRDSAFEGSNSKLGLALGRPVTEIEAWLDGNGVIDDDVIMKARGIAKERAVEIE